MTCQAQAPPVINHWKIITQSEEKSAICAAVETARAGECMEEKAGSGTVGLSGIDQWHPHPPPSLPSDPNSLRECPVDPCTTSYPVPLQTTTFCQLHSNQQTTWPLDHWPVWKTDQFIETPYILISFLQYPAEQKATRSSQSNLTKVDKSQWKPHLTKLKTS